MIEGHMHGLHLHTVWDVIAVPSVGVTFASALLRWLPTPGDIKRIFHRCPPWYMVIYNILRRASINGKYSERRPRDKQPLHENACAAIGGK